MVCSQCGKEIPEGALFCCWCGAKCAGKVCAVCGAKLRSDQLFCHECGLKCDSEKPQVTERTQVEAPHMPEKPRVQKLHISRKLQIGTSEMIIRIYINNIFKDIGAGESIYFDVVTDRELRIEIKGYEHYEQSSPKLNLKFSKAIALTDMDNPHLYLSVAAGANGWPPKLEVTVKGAKVWMWHEKQVEEPYSPDEPRVQKLLTFSENSDSIASEINRAIFYNNFHDSSENSDSIASEINRAIFYNNFHDF